MSTQPRVKAASVAIHRVETGPEPDDEEEVEYWQESNDEQFFPLEVVGTQELRLDAVEPRRGQLCEVLLSFPQVLATRPGSSASHQHGRCSPNTAEAIPDTLCLEESS